MSHLSTLKLHQLRYGELAGDELREARAHIDACPQCRDRLAMQEQARAAFVLEPVPEALRTPQTSRPTWGWGWEWRWIRAGSIGVFAALLLAVLLQPSEVRFKGEVALPSIEVWVDVGEGRRPLRDEESLGQGDKVQLRYAPEDAAFTAIAGRDSSGAIEVYRVFSTPTGRGGLVDVPFSLTLDDAPGIQEFFVVLGNRPLDSATVREAVVRHPELTAGVRLLTVSLAKDSPHP